MRSLLIELHYTGSLMHGAYSSGMQREARSCLLLRAAGLRQCGACLLCSRSSLKPKSRRSHLNGRRYSGR